MKAPYIIAILTLAVLVTGFGWLATLPIGEGFDELLYFSYIQELADTKRLPTSGTSFMSGDVLAYRERLPTAYLSTPPYEDLEGGITYRRFFTLPSTHKAIEVLTKPRNYTPSKILNTPQHPPIYYAAMAPIYSVSKHWNWKTQMALMRAVSWMFAFGGYVLGVGAILRFWPEENSTTVAAISAAWPFIAPMYFSEMARLGSDSLCLLIMGGAWWMLLKIAGGKVVPKARDYAILGAFLGIGLLTKAFFMPITVAIAIFLFLRGEKKGLAILLPFSLLLGVPWYLYKEIATGVLTGGQEQIQLAQQGGLAAGLAKNFNIYGLVRGLSAVVASTAWAGTFSLARFQEIFLAPLVALMTVPIMAYGVRLMRARLSDFVWAPAAIVLMFAAGLAHHVLVALAMTGLGNNTPGWYLHILTGPLGFIYALGLLWLIKSGIGRWGFIVLASYTSGYLAIVSWVQLAMYAGCVTKQGAIRYYAFPEGSSSLLDAGRIVHNLSVIAQPYIGIPLLFGGIALVVVGLAMLSSQLMVLGKAAESGANNG